MAKYLVTPTDGTSIPENEPCFVIRAQDVFALKAIQAYIDMTYDVVSEQMINELCKHRELIRRWRETHATKIPD